MTKRNHRRKHYETVLKMKKRLKRSSPNEYKKKLLPEIYKNDPMVLQISKYHSRTFSCREKQEHVKRYELGSSL